MKTWQFWVVIVLVSGSPYLKKILQTHWMRTALINGYALVLFVWTVQAL